MNPLELLKTIPSLTPKISHVCAWEKKQGGLEYQLILVVGKEFNHDEVSILKDVFKTPNVRFGAKDDRSKVPSIWISP